MNKTLGVFAFAVLVAAAVPCQPAETVEATLQGQKVEGYPFTDVHRQMHLLGRDGRLWELDPDQAASLKSVSSPFRPDSLSEFRAALLRELGNDYEVSATGHYVIAHPRGQRDRWAERFEDLYRSFVRYFSVRGLTPGNPLFPMVGVVCRNRGDFARHATMQGGVPGSVLGYYDIDSNRLNIYDMGGGSNPANWRKNAAVLIHEATHQTAFNTGVHSRFSRPPVWLAEGLAMLFEAPGVYDSHAYPQSSDRVNRDRLRVFRQSLAPRHRPEILASMIASDAMFQSNPGAAYAEAWALTFFLVETQPQKYVQYLRRTASHGAYETLTPAERTAEFAGIFGADWRMLEAQFLRFMADVK